MNLMAGMNTGTLSCSGGDGWILWNANGVQGSGGMADGSFTYDFK